MEITRKQTIEGSQGDFIVTFDDYSIEINSVRTSDDGKIKMFRNGVIYHNGQNIGRVRYHQLGSKKQPILSITAPISIFRNIYDHLVDFVSSFNINTVDGGGENTPIDDIPVEE